MPTILNDAMDVQMGLLVPQAISLLPGVKP